MRWDSLGLRFWGKQDLDFRQSRVCAFKIHGLRVEVEGIPKNLG